MRRANFRHRQYGAILITVALTLLFLLGFMGIAIDFGRLFIVRTELQTAVDSCALAAANELDGASDSLNRATNAGVTAGNLNRINLQGEGAGLVATDVVFSDALNGAYSHTFLPVANAKYARCSRTRSGIAPWLLQAMSGFMGNAAYASNNSVAALGTATRVSSQTNCMLPVGICQKDPADPMGFKRGDWISGVTNDSDDVTSGQFRWVEFTGAAGGTRDIKDLLTGQGQCNLPGMSTQIGKSGKSNGAVEAWNTRFGIYKGTYTATNATPDLTGYAWYESGTAPPASMLGRYDDKTNKGFQYHRSQNDPYEGDNKNPDTKGLNTQGSLSNKDAHVAGTNRRIITTPVVDCATMTMKGTACVLMLHPLEKNASGKNSKMWLEFISDARAASNNPCTTSGLAGGTGGPMVPALVQ